jgi:16S rRNA (guanine527-N7)-methyltransferase
VRDVADTEPTTGQRRVIERYLDELEVWNRRLNLTRVPRDHAWSRHVGETRGLLAVADLRDGWRVADIGTGGGIPGLLIAVLRPLLALTLVEADRRKAGFLVHAAGLLELDNVEVVAQRAEEMGRDPVHVERYDAAVSRAAAPPPLLVRLTMPLLRSSGTLWALVADADRAVGELPANGTVRAWAAAPGVLAVEKLGDPP